MLIKRKLYVVILLFFIGNFIHCNVKHNDVIRKQLFDLNWKFIHENKDLASEPDFNDQNWRSIDLPHDWSKDKLLNTGAKESLSIGWYRKNFEIPDYWADKSIFIDFDGISEGNEIFINGTPVNKTDGENSTVHANINVYLNTSGNNVIAIRLANNKQDDGSWKYESGIYKHVWLVIKEAPSQHN